MMNRLFLKCHLFVCVCLILGLSVNPAKAQCAKEAARIPLLQLNEQPTVVSDEPFVNMKGEEVRVSDYRGKAVLLNHWAIWCGPCLREMPSIMRLSDKLDGVNAEVIALSMDRVGPKKVEHFALRKSWKIEKVFNDTKMKYARASKIQNIPATQIIDPQGQEFGRLVGVWEWDGPEVIDLLKCLGG